MANRVLVDQVLVCVSPEMGAYIERDMQIGRGKIPRAPDFAPVQHRGKTMVCYGIFANRQFGGEELISYRAARHLHFSNRMYLNQRFRERMDLWIEQL